MTNVSPSSDCACADGCADVDAVPAPLSILGPPTSSSGVDWTLEMPLAGPEEGFMSVIIALDLFGLVSVSTAAVAVAVVLGAAVLVVVVVIIVVIVVVDADAWMSLRG